MAHKPNDGTVLNVIQAVAADSVLAGGKWQINDGTNDLLSEALKLADATSFLKIAYAVGTAQVEAATFVPATFLADSQYKMAIEFPAVAGFNNVQVNEDSGRNGANELVPIREYVVWVGAAVPTANSLRDAFIARINGDSGARVTATSGGAGIVTLTMDNVADGAFSVTVTGGATVANTTPYVAPAGTPAIAEADFPTLSSLTATYTTYEVQYTDFRRSNAVSGGIVGYPEYLRIYVDAGATNYAALETEMDAVLAGTHTPVADYLGV